MTLNGNLNTELLQQALQILGVNPDLDLFASRINTQRSSYVSFKPDPRAKAVDAFTLSWHKISCFSTILRHS